MAIQFNDNLAISLNKPLDARYFTTDTNQPFSTTTSANTAIPLSRRHLGLTVLVGSTTNAVEYWYMGGTADGNLVAKTSGVVSADNGLNLSGTTVKLGGPLLTNTSINLATYTLALKSATTYTTGIDILPGTATDNPTSGNDRVAITGNLSVSAQSYFGGNVGMGATPFLSSNSGDVRLNIFKIGLPGTGKGSIGASSSSVELTTAGTYTGFATSYFGNVSRVYFSFNGTGAQVLNPAGSYTGAFSYFQFATAKNVSGGVCSAHAAQAQFQDVSLGGASGTIDRVITYRAMSPVADVLIGYNGSVTEMVGLQIESQKGPIGDATVTTSYGIKQLGGSDINQLNGPVILQKVYGQGSFADDSIAAANGIPIGGLYRTGNVLKIRIT